MNVPTKPVLFSRPENWESMSDEEKAAYADQLLDQMGMPREEGPK